jgi:cytochrome c peroxidase
MPVQLSEESCHGASTTLPHRRALRSLLLLAALGLGGCLDGNNGSDLPQAATTNEFAEAEEADPAQVAIGERLFLETRFAQFYAANSGGDANTNIVGDPVLETTLSADGSTLPGPFRGQSANCRTCHLVDEQLDTPGGGMRTYADFARRSPLSDRGDLPTSVRNSPALVNASLPRTDGRLFHFDGEFASMRDLVRTTLTGRMLGWLPGEADDARAHVAHIIRNDDGNGDLAQEFGGAYTKILTATDADIPEELRLPEEFRIDVKSASDAEILEAVARLISAYVTQLEFARDDNGEFDLSPYDRFLAANGLPRQPNAGEPDETYGRRLLGLLNALSNPTYISDDGTDASFAFHQQPFQFGEAELRGLKVFLSEPVSPALTDPELQMGGIGNCIACHTPPVFTDFGLHNTGIAQNGYDAVHGAGDFMNLDIPDLATRAAAPDAYLPRTQDKPSRPEYFRSIPDPADERLVDLGVWNIFANPDFDNAEHQARLRGRLCAIDTGVVDPNCGLSDDQLLSLAIGAVKTPSLRDLGHSAPFMHDGSLNTLEAVVQNYRDNSALARAGKLRAGDPQMARIAFSEQDLMDLVAFLESLNEDYE